MPGKRALRVQDVEDPEIVGEIELRLVEQGFARKWVATCPPCGRPVRTVFYTNDCWRCRTCSGLQYRSVREHDRRVDEIIRAMKRGDERAIDLALDGSRGGHARIARAKLYNKVMRKLMARAGAQHAS